MASSSPGAIGWIDLTVPDAEEIRDFYAARATPGPWPTRDSPITSSATTVTAPLPMSPSKRDSSLRVDGP